MRLLDDGPVEFRVSSQTESHTKVDRSTENIIQVIVRWSEGRRSSRRAPGSNSRIPVEKIRDLEKDLCLRGVSRMEGIAEIGIHNEFAGNMIIVNRRIVRVLRRTMGRALNEVVAVHA